MSAHATTTDTPVGLPLKKYIGHIIDFFFSETSNNARTFLNFLHYSRAAFKPPTRPEVPFDPG